MRLRGVIGSALCGLLLGGCTGAELPGSRPSADAPPAVSGWRPPADAPGFCTVLAGADGVGNIPQAVGLLLADPTDPQPAWRLAQSAGELRAALEAVREEGGHEELAAALDDLVSVLTVASSGPPEPGTPERIADGLAAVGRSAQSVCEYPT